MTKSVSKYTFFLGFKSYWIFLTGNTCVFCSTTSIGAKERNLRYHDLHFDILIKLHKVR